MDTLILTKRGGREQHRVSWHMVSPSSEVALATPVAVSTSCARLQGGGPGGLGAETTFKSLVVRREPRGTVRAGLTLQQEDVR